MPICRCSPPRSKRRRASTRTSSPHYRTAIRFKTIVGDIKYGPNGEWAEPRVLEIQFHGVEGNGLDQWRNDSRVTILWPPKVATGEMVYPYTTARK